jgi:pyruvate/2-oxoacid:ferredoxin oxidoreductase alpha subunit
MKDELLDSYESAAMGAKLSKIGFLAKHGGMINKRLKELVDKEECSIMDVESQSAALSAAIAAEACGKRAFLSLDSISSAREFLTASYMRLPIVAVLSDITAARDLGWLVFLPENNQEILDTVIQAYRICEDNKVLLPAIIKVDFPIRENILPPSEKSVSNFLPKLRLKTKLDPHNPTLLNTDGDFRNQQQKAMENALKVMETVNEKWKTKFKRLCPTVEEYFPESDYLLVVSGSDSPTAKAAVNKLREQGESIGLVRIRSLRPFPDMKVLEGKKIAVIDRDISLGSTGIIHSELGYSNYISKRPINEKDVFDIYNRLKTAEKEENVWIL